MNKLMTWLRLDPEGRRSLEQLNQELAAMANLKVPEHAERRVIRDRRRRGRRAGDSAYVH